MSNVLSIESNKHDEYDDADRTDIDTICICINKLPYRLTIDDAIKLSERLEELLVETITYDNGRN